MAVVFTANGDRMAPGARPERSPTNSPFGTTIPGEYPQQTAACETCNHLGRGDCCATRIYCDLEEDRTKARLFELIKAGGCRAGRHEPTE